MRKKISWIVITDVYRHLSGEVVDGNMGQGVDKITGDIPAYYKDRNPKSHPKQGGVKDNWQAIAGCFAQHFGGKGSHRKGESLFFMPLFEEIRHCKKNRP